MNGFTWIKSSDDKSDIDKLEDTLKNNTDSSKKEESNSNKPGQGNVPRNPTIDDLIKFKSNLNLAVPAGFIMLHNDFTELLKQKASAGESGSSTASKITAVSTAISAATDLVSAFKSPAGLNEVLNDKEINEALAKDPTVFDLRLSYTKGYLKAYYNNLIENLGYSYDLDSEALAKSISFGSLASDFTSAIASGIGNAVSSVMEAISGAAQNRELNELPEIKAVRGKGYSAYLKAYYANLLGPNGYQISAENLNNGTFLLEKATGANAAGHIMDVITTGITGTLGNAVESVGNAVVELSANTDINSDEVVKATRRAGYSAYLKAYYANMIKPQGYKVTLDSLNNGTFALAEDSTNAAAIIDIITTGFASIAGNAVEALGNSLIDTTATAFLNADDSVKDIRRKGYKAYLKAYYANMLKPQGYAADLDLLNADQFLLKEDKTNAAAIIDIITTGLSSVMGNAVEALGSAITDVSANAALNSNETIKSIRVAGYSAYLKAYYGMLLEQFGLHVSIEDLNAGNFAFKEATWGEGKGKGLWNDITGAIGKGFANLFTGGGSGSTKNLLDIDTTSLDKDSEIMSIHRSGYGAYLTTYYANLRSNLENHKDNLLSKNDVEDMGDAFRKAFNNAITASLEITNNSKTIASSFDDSNVRRAISGVATQIVNIKNLLDPYISEMRENKGAPGATVVIPEPKKGSSNAYAEFKNNQLEIM